MPCDDPICVRLGSKLPIVSIGDKLINPIVGLYITIFKDFSIEGWDDHTPKTRQP